MAKLLHSAVEAALHETGAVLLRQNKHMVFGLPNNRVVVLACTPHGSAVWKMQVRHVRRTAEMPPIERKPS